MNYPTRKTFIGKVEVVNENFSYPESIKTKIVALSLKGINELGLPIYDSITGEYIANPKSVIPIDKLNISLGSFKNIIGYVDNKDIEKAIQNYETMYSLEKTEIKTTNIQESTSKKYNPEKHMRKDNIIEFPTHEKAKQLSKTA